MTLRDALRRAIVANEIGGRTELAYRFSDAKSGKSGLSFGICQFDVANNPTAVTILRECGFTTDEIDLLKNKNSAETKAAMNRLSLHLYENKDIIDRWDTKHIAGTVSHVSRLCSGVPLSGDETFIHICDYHNQFYMSPGGKMHQFLKAQRNPVTPEMILAFKLTLPWGTTHPADVYRRFNNIRKIWPGGSNSTKKEGV